MTRAGSALPRAVVGSAVAVASVAVATAFTAALWPFVKPTATPLFFAAVVISSWFGGTGPGLLATVLSVLVTKPVPPHELAAVVAAVAGRTGAR